MTLYTDILYYYYNYYYHLKFGATLQGGTNEDLLLQVHFGRYRNLLCLGELELWQYRLNSYRCSVGHFSTDRRVLPYSEKRSENVKLTLYGDEKTFSIQTRSSIAPGIYPGARTLWGLCPHHVRLF